MTNDVRAFMFPGQGSQSVGMGRELAGRFFEARQVFEEADDALGFSISSICFEGPDDRLRLTAYTQPAIVTVSVAVDRVLKGRGIRPSVVAGHSLGEYAALVSAGVLRFADAVRAVHARGQLMQEAVPAGEGAMAAVLGLAAERVTEVCAEVSAETGALVAAANLNSPLQTVISGAARAVERAAGALKAAGARRVLTLPVSAPFHCALMQPAQDRLAPLLDEIMFVDAEVPVVPNVLARAERNGTALRQALVQQVTAPVRWVESMHAVRDTLRPEAWYEAGPGRVLTGLLHQIDHEMHAHHVDDLHTLEKALAAPDLHLTSATIA